jgi:hypothetical protein
MPQPVGSAQGGPPRHEGPQGPWQQQFRGSQREKNQTRKLSIYIASYWVTVAVNKSFAAQVFTDSFADQFYCSIDYLIC